MVKLTLVDWAREGHPEHLQAKISRLPDTALNAEEREYLCDMLRRTPPGKPSHRPKSKIRAWEVVHFSGMVLALEATGLLRKNAIDQGHQRGNGDLLTKGMLWKYLGERDRDHPELAKGDRFLRERGNAIRAQKSKEVRAKSDFLISNSPSANPRTIARLRRSLSEGRGGKT